MGKDVRTVKVELKEAIGYLDASERDAIERRSNLLSAKNRIEDALKDIKDLI